MNKALLAEFGVASAEQFANGVRRGAFECQQCAQRLHALRDRRETRDVRRRHQRAEEVRVVGDVDWRLLRRASVLLVLLQVEDSEVSTLHQVLRQNARKNTYDEQKREARK